MSKSIKQFEFQFNANNIRAISDEHGNPWFVAKDVCAVLGYENHNETVKYHCRGKGVANRYPLGEKGVAKRYPLSTEGGTQYPLLIDEGNLYRLTIKSKKPEAEPFEAWVCDEVLPSIRKHGFYVKPGKKPTTADIFGDLIEPELTPFQRVKPSLLINLGKMSPTLAHAYLVECGVTPEYVEEQIGSLGDAAPLLGIKRDSAETANKLTTDFVNDWKAGAIDAPLIPCSGRQVLRLFNYWAQSNGLNVHIGESQIMTAIYKQPGFRRHRTRINFKDGMDQRACLMIDGQMPPVNMSMPSWMADCIEQMESALQRFGA